MPSIRGLRPGGASRHVHVHRHNVVNPHDHGVRPVVRPPVGGAAAHCNYPLGFRHLLVENLYRLRHLLHHRASHNHHVRLPGRGPRHYPEAVKIVVGHVGAYHLDGAAGQAECHGPQGRLSGQRNKLLRPPSDYPRRGPVENAPWLLVAASDAYLHCNTPFFQP